MISKFNTPSMSASAGGTSGGTDKTILFVGLLLGGFLLWKFVIKPEMDKKNTIIYESDNDGDD
jgi:hypothetical protein